MDSNEGKNNLPTTLSALQNTETIVPPLPPAQVIIPPFERHLYPPHGDNVLLVIPTSNSSKIALLSSHFRDQFQSYLSSSSSSPSPSPESGPRPGPDNDAKSQPAKEAKLHILPLPVPTGVGEQPYDLPAGIEGAHNRITNALRELDDRDKRIRQQHDDDGHGDGHGDGYGAFFLEENGIGTVIVASIESFIQIGDCGDCGDDDIDNDTENTGTGTEKKKEEGENEMGFRQRPTPTDYGMIVIHNATTGETTSVVSKGTTVDGRFVEEARRKGGFVIGGGGGGGGVGSEGSYGAITVGSVIAERVPGVDGADWHSVVVGKSRYEILREAVGGVVIPWGR